MFRVRSTESDRTLRLAIVAVLTLSVAALAVTTWVMIDFLAEQAIVHELIAELPEEAKGKAEALEGELRWQFRLSMLIVLNLVVTGFAIVLLSRAYRSSQKSLRDVKVLAGDILSSMDQAVITTDLEGNVTSINRRGLELLGTHDECIGKPLASMDLNRPMCEQYTATATDTRLSTIGSVGNEPTSKFQRQIGKQVDSFRRDWSVEQTDTMTRDFETSVNGHDRVLRAFCQSLADIDDNEIGYVLQLRDVTERILIEDRIRRMERYMGLGSLAAGLHHEIKNPLAALSLHVQLLEEQLEDYKSSEDTRQMLRIIQTEVSRIGNVLEGFRDFASIDRLNLASVNLHELIRQQLESIRLRAEQQNVVVDVQLDETETLLVTADKVRLEQVLLNLSVNALDAMPDGGRLTVQASKGREVASIKVIDTGIGIPMELHDKIFDAYFTTKGTGTGLGLALCDKIMRQHDGGLHFQSTESRTIFEMTLPLERSDG